jgi:hypothetical protein
MLTALKVVGIIVVVVIVGLSAAVLAFFSDADNYR